MDHDETTERMYWEDEVANGNNWVFYSRRADVLK